MLHCDQKCFWYLFGILALHIGAVFHNQRNRIIHFGILIPEGVATKQVEHCLIGENLLCPQCGDIMSEIGKEVIRALEIIPAQTIVREDI